MHKVVEKKYKKVTVELLGPKRLKFILWRDINTQEFTKILTPPEKSSWELFGKKANLSTSEMNSLYEATLKKQKEEKEEKLLDSLRPQEEVEICVRGDKQKYTDGKKFKGVAIIALKQALSGSPKEYKLVDINPEDRDKLCFLQVTFKRFPDLSPVKRNPFAVATDLGNSNPKPCFSWFTSNGFIMMAFSSYSLFSAREMASMAALDAITKYPACEVSISTTVKHPGFTSVREGKEYKCSLVKESLTSLEGALSQWRVGEYGSAKTEEIEAYLEKSGFEIGVRYPHEHCPFNPGPSSSGMGSPPVSVTQDGIKCFSCQGKNHISGGWRNWDSLIGEVDEPRLLKAVKKFVPWRQVKYIVKHEYQSQFPLDLAKLCYISLAKLISPYLDDPRVRLLTSGLIPLVKTLDGWVEESDFKPRKTDRSTFMNFSSCQSVTGSEEKGYRAVTNPDLVDNHLHGRDIPGWSPVYPVRGGLIYHQNIGFTKYPNAVVAQVKGRYFIQLPRYLEKGHKDLIPYEECLEQFNDLYPGINMDYLELLIVSRGIAEGEVQTCWIMATGPSGAGKTKTVEIANQVVGDNISDIKYSTNRFLQDVGESSRKSGYLIFDEFGKNVRNVRPIDAFSRLLDIDGSFEYHRLYQGTVSVDVCSVVVVTNTQYGKKIMTHKQIGRRFAHVELTSAVKEWDKKQNISKLRNNHSDLCDSYLTHLMNKHFWGEEAKPITFRDKVRSIGFPMLEDSHEDDSVPFSPKRLINRLFYQVRDLDHCNKSWNGKGWKKVHLRDEDQDILETLEQLSPGVTTSSRWYSETMGEHGLNDILEPVVDQPIKFAVAIKGNIMGIRFSQGKPGDGREKIHNEEIALKSKREDYLIPDENEV
jgi:hypothetical protein